MSFAPDIKTRMMQQAACNALAQADGHLINIIDPAEILPPRQAVILRSALDDSLSATVSHNFTSEK